MQMQKVKTGLSLATIVASMAVLLFHFFQLPPKIDPRPHIGIGNVLAEQAAKALGTGGRIILVAPDTATFRWPGPEVQLKALFSALRKRNLAVAVTNVIKLDPGRLVRVNADDFMNLLRKQSEADVVVSLLGPPLPNADQKARLPAKRPRVIAVCAGDMPKQINLSALFDDNLLHVAIVSRPAPAVGLPETDDPQTWFDHFYQVAASRTAVESLSLAPAP